uniref:Ribosomal protein S8 n=1 Tax=Chlorokybus atmophyticus TaxID=3144 RepID=A6YEC2_CHLAT|nr:ribosomal protein S8 [Chlorokybus atmophyticus]ABO15124.1 ribosomal protein S8 [Chlorokybus atmophyticus]
MDSLNQFYSIIQNGLKAKRSIVSLRNSKLVWKLLNVLHREGYIRGLELKNNKINVWLKYKNDKPVINKIKRISRPSNRVYLSSNNISLYKRGVGIILLSTRNGIYSDIDARLQGLGGEILCQVF